MRHFKLALIVTGIAFVIAVAVAAYGLYTIDRTGRTHAEKKARAELLGQGLGIALGVAAGPLWIYGAYKLGQERRAARDGSKPSSRKSAASRQTKSRRKG